MTTILRLVGPRERKSCKDGLNARSDEMDVPRGRGLVGKEGNVTIITSAEPIVA